MTKNTKLRQYFVQIFYTKNMQGAGRVLLTITTFLLYSSSTLAFSPQPNTDDPIAFHSCFYLGNIVDDLQNPNTPELDINEVSFHDGRAVQLYAMGKLEEGHSKDYIESHIGKISDFARAVPAVPENDGDPDWYDGRVASLAGILFCAGDDADADGLSDTLPRASCPAGVQSLFPEGSVLERLKQYMQPCCVLSGDLPEDTVDFFPCALQ